MKSFTAHEKSLTRKETAGRVVGPAQPDHAIAMQASRSKVSSTSSAPKLNGEATRRWNVEAIDGLLDDPEWAKLPRHKSSKVYDENLKLAGCRILDAFIDMSEEQRASRYGSMTQDVHGAPFLDQPRTHAHSLDSLQKADARARM